MAASCIKCNDNCDKCKDANTCLTCPAGVNMEDDVSEDGKCICKVSFGYKLANDNKSCEACHTNCKECELGKLNGKCLTCKSNRIVTKNKDELFTCGDCKEGYTELDGSC